LDFTCRYATRLESRNDAEHVALDLVNHNLQVPSRDVHTQFEVSFSDTEASITDVNGVVQFTRQESRTSSLHIGIDIAGTAQEGVEALFTASDPSSFNAAFCRALDPDNDYDSYHLQRVSSDPETREGARSYDARNAPRTRTRSRS
jgi:hypothetical protein